MADHTSTTDHVTNPTLNDSDNPAGNPTTNPILSHTPNRRQLLSGASALALSGVALSGVALPVAGPPLSVVPKTQDPASLAYVRAAKAEGELRICPLDDRKAYYALYHAFINAELALADTPSTSLMGVRAKIWRMSHDMLWREGDNCMPSRLGLSVLADLNRMIGWPVETPDIGRRS